MTTRAPQDLVLLVSGDTGEVVSKAPLGIEADEFLAGSGYQLEPLFPPGQIDEAPATIIESMQIEGLEAATFYRVEAPEDHLQAIASALIDHPRVLAAYVKPGGEPPQAPGMEVKPRKEPPPPVTPDFTARQGYLGPAPAGMDVPFAWSEPGGRGEGVQVVDLEWNWNFDHEDHPHEAGGVVGGAPAYDPHHGTAVIGEIGADDNGVGVAGICPDAHLTAVAFERNTARSIALTTDMLRTGDVMLLEIHLPGPRHGGDPREDQAGYIAIEWWPDDFAAIHRAVRKGIVVVEAAGNGQEDLDDILYDVPGRGFPPGWTNPFRRSSRDSGAIVVGAGAPPPGTHGADHGLDRSRLEFSNFGGLVDAQAWGWEVTTTGYGDLQGGPDPNRWYGDVFGGTSSASPMIAGVIACLQGIRRAKGLSVLSPSQVRALLRATGSPQQDAPGRPKTQRIGRRPDLQQLVPAALAV